MSNFRTTFIIPEFSPKLNYQSKSLFIGSCFTENIGNYLKDLKFQVINNPTGIIYNPVSIGECIEDLVKGKQMTENDLEFYNDTWFSFTHHSRYSHPDKNVCLNKMNEDLKIASEFIRQADFLFITLGSAYTYVHNETKNIVSNCHKFPASTFSKLILELKSIGIIFEHALKELFRVNPKVNIIFTVSPVRHWNDGVIENQHSKSILITAIHELISKNKNCSYFPAYELMMDDLRDYRFYAEDMLHPNDTAVEYIRNKFIKTYIDNDSEIIMNEIQKLVQAKNHRPFKAQIELHKDFRKKQLDQITVLNRKIPFLDLKEFEDFFTNE